MTSTLVVEAPDIAAKDYIATLRSGARIAALLTHGTVAGNIVEVGGTKLQITDIAESKEDDIVMYTISLLHTVEGGAPDLTITAK